MIRIVMSSSPEYLDYLIITIWSVMEHLDPSKSVKLSVLHAGVSDAKIESVYKYLSCWNNLVIEFINILPFVKEFNLQENDIIKCPASFPLLSGLLFPEDEKIILLDSDLIVMTDLNRLWTIPLKNNLIAAVIDVDFNGHINSRSLKYKRYYTSKVQLQDPYSYVQAGVIVYNLIEFRKQFSPGEIFIDAICEKFRFDDQDILNLRCTGKIHFLDMRWNVLHNNLGARLPYLISLAQLPIQKQYIEARQDPWIIHYAGCQKPWDDPECDFSEEYWEMVFKTPVGINLFFQYTANNRSTIRIIKRYFRKQFHHFRYITRILRMKIRKSLSWE